MLADVCVINCSTRLAHGRVHTHPTISFDWHVHEQIEGAWDHVRLDAEGCQRFCEIAETSAVGWMLGIEMSKGCLAARGEQEVVQSDRVFDDRKHPFERFDHKRLPVVSAIVSS